MERWNTDLITVIGFFIQIDKTFNMICEKTDNRKLQFVESDEHKGFKDTILILGILETIDLITFNAVGGKNSQIYIYVN